MKKSVSLKSGFLNKLKPYWPILVILFVSLVLLRSFFKPGFPETHDGQSHLARLANFHLATIDRHFPIRWARNLNYKFGYPVFNFNYFTPYVLALIPGQLGLSFEASFKLVFIFSLFFGGLFWYLLLKKKFGSIPGLVAGLFYISAPYQLVNILIRGSVGEIVALGLFPFLFWSIDWLVDKPSRLSFLTTTLGLATLALTHNISFFFGVPILGLFALMLIWLKKDWHRLRPVIVSFIFSVGLTLFFWIPALLEKKFTNLDSIEMSYEYIKHFPSLGQLIYSPWNYGFSVEGLKDGFTFQLGPFHWLIGLLSIAVLIKTYLKSKKLNWWGIFFTLIFIVSIIFMMPITLPIWKILPMVRYIQFPWRLLGFSIISVTVLAGFLAKKLPKISFILVFGAIIYSSLIAKPGGWFNWNDDFYYNFPFSSSIKGLNMPKWFTLEVDQRSSFGNRNMFDLEGITSFKEFSWKTQKHIYQLNASRETKIFERTAYFPGWQVTIDDQPTQIDYQAKQYPGVISFTVPQGEHLIETSFTEATPARRLGNALSVVSLISFLSFLYFKILL